MNTWTKANTTNNLATAAKAIATAVALISGSMYLLAKIDDPMRAVQALASVIAELFGIVVALKVLAVTDMTGLDTAKLLGTITAISRVASVLMGMVGILTFFNTYGDGTKGAGAFVAAAAAVDAIALALILLALAEKNGLDIDGAVEAINGVAIAISILTVAAGFAQKLAGKADEKTLDKIAIYLAKIGGLVLAINGMASALMITAGAVAIFAAMGDRMWIALAGAGTALVGLAVAAGVLGKLDLKGVKKTAKGMAIMAASLTLLAGAAYAFALVAQMDEGGAGFASAATALIVMAGAAVVLSKSSGNMIEAAECMALMSASILIFAGAILVFGSTSVEQGLAGCVSAIGALVVLASAMAIICNHRAEHELQPRYRCDLCKRAGISAGTAVSGEKPVLHGGRACKAGPCRGGRPCGAQRIQGGRQGVPARKHHGEKAGERYGQGNGQRGRLLGCADE